MSSWLRIRLWFIMTSYCGCGGLFITEEKECGLCKLIVSGMCPAKACSLIPNVWSSFAVRIHWSTAKVWIRNIREWEVKPHIFDIDRFISTSLCVTTDLRFASLVARAFSCTQQINICPVACVSSKCVPINETVNWFKKKKKNLNVDKQQQTRLDRASGRAAAITALRLKVGADLRSSRVN